MKSSQVELSGGWPSEANEIPDGKTEKYSEEIRETPILSEKGEVLLPGQRNYGDTRENLVEFFRRQRPFFLKKLIEHLEKCIIMDVLSMLDGNQKEASKILGMKYTTFHEKIKRYHIHFQKKPVSPL